MTLRDQLWCPEDYGLPSGTSRRVFERSQLLRFAGIGLLFLGMALLVTSVSFGFFRVGELQGAEPLSVAEASAYQGEQKGPVRVEGELRSVEPKEIPDTGEEVVAGRVKVTLGFGYGKEKNERVIFLWEGFAKEAFLKDRNSSLPIALTPQQLPVIKDQRASVKYQREGSVRNSKIVAVEYGGQTWERDDTWPTGKAHASVERALLKSGQKVVVLADLANGRLVKPNSGELRIYVGTAEDAVSSLRGFAAVVACLGVAALIAGVPVYLRGRQLFLSLKQPQPPQH